MVGVNVAGQRIDRIADYVLCPWLISTADSLSVAARAQSPRGQTTGLNGWRTRSLRLLRLS